MRFFQVDSVYFSLSNHKAFEEERLFYKLTSLNFLNVYPYINVKNCAINYGNRKHVLQINGTRANFYPQLVQTFIFRSDDGSPCSVEP